MSVPCYSTFFWYADLCFPSVFSESELSLPFLFIISLLHSVHYRKHYPSYNHLFPEYGYYFPVLSWFHQCAFSGTSLYQIKIHIMPCLVHSYYLHSYSLMSKNSSNYHPGVCMPFLCLLSRFNTCGGFR